jgi:hypothetical protein
MCISAAALCTELTLPQFAVYPTSVVFFPVFLIKGRCECPSAPTRRADRRPPGSVRELVHGDAQPPPVPRQGSRRADRHEHRAAPAWGAHILAGSVARAQSSDIVGAAAPRVRDGPTGLTSVAF